ncbi:MULTISPECIES: phage tail assembly chaperone [unclassified Pseudomonas]|uniref:phage tail assembly chaperone n=1 Tax=unclassified Pseudomonas TaxID=196821 RepID=UPI002AC97E9B|nr:MULTISPECIES: phage tail assembly chaperone [unclassified Pseudomonas]MEB0045748.1 phage tail assembly chaperone [Pseudomonas sp. Dout3]MEB0098149.1 phage tail assembly chaperone [Pseudomonas sp. DC1.2]WPX60119.1 phage tail assembly chaperone [Pseudomonas sp. DC1.2]
MKRYYSQTTGCTYLLGLHTSMPADAAEISEALFLSVICNPAPGKIRAHDGQGLPYLVDAPEPVQDVAAQERAWRDGELSAVMWLRERHRDQLEISELATLTVEQFNELLMYMQALRDWPQSSDFPDSQHRPIAPAWIAGQVQ